MTCSPTIAVARYPEGAGHATRMLAVANALRERGAAVEMAGGGAGARFVALNGYDEFAPTPVDYIDAYQGASIRRVLADSVPATAARVTEYVGWLRQRDLDALVTDDMFAAIAATRTDVPLYVLKHDVPAMYRDRLERAGAAFHTSFQRAAARAFFYPTVWPPSAVDPAGVTRVPPVALDGAGRERPAPEVLVVPSHFSDLGRIADQLARQGYDVLDVGGDDWEPVPSLLPYIRDADVVVCSGYSTVMDAAVAGTPCVVHPATDEQEAVAGWLDRFSVPGFAVAPTPLDVLEAAHSPPDPPDFENGAATVAESVLDDVARGDGAATGDAGSDRTDAGRDRTTADRTTTAVDETGAHGDGRVTVDAARRRVGDASQRVADRLVAGATALGWALSAVVLHGRALVATAKRLFREGAAATRRSVARTWRTLVERVGAAAATAASAGRTTARRYRRYRTATAAMAVATVIVARTGLRGTATGFGAGVGTAARTLWKTARYGFDRAVSSLHRVADVVAPMATRFAALGRRFATGRRSSE